MGVALGVGLGVGVVVGAGVVVAAAGLKGVTVGRGVAVEGGAVASSCSRETAEIGSGVGMTAVGRRAVSSVRIRRGSAAMRLRTGGKLTAATTNTPSKIRAMRTSLRMATV
jgi:hypothetical protein